MINGWILIDILMLALLCGLIIGYNMRKSEELDKR